MFKVRLNIVWLPISTDRTWGKKNDAFFLPPLPPNPSLSTPSGRPIPFLTPLLHRSPRLLYNRTLLGLDRLKIGGKSGGCGNGRGVIGR